MKNVEAQAHRAINDDRLLGVFAQLGIQRDDEHLSLRLWCATSKPIFDLPSAMNTSTIADFTGHRACLTVANLAVDQKAPMLGIF